LHHNAAENNSFTEQGIKRLWREVFPGVGYFQPERLEKLQEPAQYPAFDYGFIRTFSDQHPASGAVNPSFFYSERSPMTTIRVDPPILQNCSQRIQSNATTLTSVGNKITSSAQGAPSCDGQFGPKVRAIAAGASAQAGQLSGAFSNLAGWLSNKAQQFINADGGSAAVLGASTSRLTWALHPGIIGIVSGVFKSIINRLFPRGLPWSHLTGNRISTDSLKSIYDAKTTANLNLRANFGLGSAVLGVLPAGASLQVLEGKMKKDGYTWVRVRTADGRVGWVAEQFLTPVKDKDKQVDASPKPEPKSESRDYLGIAEKVQKGTPNATDLSYYRNGYNGVQSNCTWLVAQAVYEASGGKIKVTGWGDALNWLEKAEINMNDPNGIVKEYDKSPETGDIMHFLYTVKKGNKDKIIGHVAFVENTWVDEKTGKTYVTWVEEQASGEAAGWSNIEQIIKDGQPILRWRVTREVDDNFLNKYGVNFIHLKY